MKRSKIGKLCTIGLCADLTYKIQDEKNGQYFVKIESNPRDGALIQGWVNSDRVTVL